MNKIDRISKVIARRTGASRRDVEKLILDHRVKINNKIAQTLGEKISYQEKIFIDNMPIPPLDKTKLYIFHKPVKMLCSTKDELGRAVIYDILPEKYHNLKYVGRLDYMSEGLLLLTNDGELSRYLTLPANNIERSYQVKVYGRFDEQKLKEKFSRKINIEGESFFVKDFQILERGETNSWLGIVLNEGKNREIRKIMEKFDLKISKLVRIGYGPYQLGNLKRGAIREVEVKDFVKQE